MHKNVGCATATFDSVGSWLVGKLKDLYLANIKYSKHYIRF